MPPGMLITIIIFSAVWVDVVKSYDVYCCCDCL